jgi:hypothetical protein
MINSAVLQEVSEFGSHRLGYVAWTGDTELAFYSRRNVVMRKLFPSVSVLFEHLCKYRAGYLEDKEMLITAKLRFLFNVIMPDRIS